MTDAPTKTAPRARARRPRRTIDAKLRARIERAVDRLIAALDVMDAPSEDREEDDPAEDNGDAEPSLGSLQSTPTPCAFGYGGYSSQGHQLSVSVRYRDAELTTMTVGEFARWQIGSKLGPVFS